MYNKKYLISQDKTLLDALVQINGLSEGPLVLFAVDGNNRMVGTLTDGDARRALIKGAKVEDRVRYVMHKNFNFLRRGVNDDVEHIKEQRNLLMKLVPILDKSNHIYDIINLEEHRSKLPMDAIIMAGGKGTRLRPLTDKVPKPLLKVGDKSIIDYNVENLISVGVEHISVTVNYLKEQIEEHFENKVNGVQVHCVREPEYLGTIGSIKFVKRFYNDFIVIMNSDLFTNIDFESFYLHFLQYDADMSVAVVPYSVSVPYGIFKLSGRNIRGIKEKPTYNYYANAGIYLIKKRLLDMVPNGVFFNATDLIDLLIKKKMRIIRFLITGFWIDIGKHEDYAKAQEIIKHL